MHGLYLEGAGWDINEGCLVKQNPKQLIQDLPVMKVIPIESHKLKLQVKFIFNIHRRIKTANTFILIIQEHIPNSRLYHFRQTKRDGCWFGIRSRLVHSRAFESLGAPRRLSYS